MGAADGNNEGWSRVIEVDDLLLDAVIGTLCTPLLVPTRWWWRHAYLSTHVAALPRLPPPKGASAAWRCTTPHRRWWHSPLAQCPPAPMRSPPPPCRPTRSRAIGSELSIARRRNSPPSCRRRGEVTVMARGPSLSTCGRHTSSWPRSPRGASAPPPTGRPGRASSRGRVWATTLGGALMSTNASILVDSVGPPSTEVCRTAASFP
jgi:hypothetical protein